jgi:hypothetical protein
MTFAEREKLCADAIKFWSELNGDSGRFLTRFGDTHIYREQKRQGRRFGKRLFLVAWIIHQVKMNWLIKNGKARKWRRIDGQWIYLIGPARKLGADPLKVEPTEWDKAPYIEETQRVLKDLFEHVKVDLTDNLLVYAGRAKGNSYCDMKSEIAQNLWREGHKSGGPGPTYQVYWDAHRIARFVRGKKPQEATRLELERRFRKMKKEDLGGEMLCALLRSNYHIVRFRRGRSIVYKQGTPRHIVDARGERWEIGFAKPPQSKSVQS